MATHMEAPVELSGKEERMYKKALKRIEDGIRPLAQRQLLMSGQPVKIEMPELRKLDDEQREHVVQHLCDRLEQQKRQLVVLPADPKQPKKRFVTVAKA